jgi:hypothetical protein
LFCGLCLETNAVSEPFGSSGSFSGSTVLALGKYATTHILKTYFCAIISILFFLYYVFLFSPFPSLLRPVILLISFAAVTRSKVCLNKKEVGNPSRVQ